MWPNMLSDIRDDSVLASWCSLNVHVPETMSTIQGLFLAGDQKAGPHNRRPLDLVVVVPQLEEGSCDTKMWEEGAGRWPLLQDPWRKWEELRSRQEHL